MNFRTGSVIRVLGAGAIGGAMIAGALWFDHAPRVSETNAAAVVVARGDARVGVQKRSDEWRRTLPEPRAQATAMESDEELGPYEPPETLTGRFSERLLEQTIRGSMSGGITDTTRNQIVSESIASIERETRTRFYSRADILSVNPGGLSSYRTYGNEVSRVLARHSIDNEHEMIILQRAVADNDPDALRPLAAIERAYSGMVDDLLRIPTPSDLSKQHVDLINTLVSLTADVAAMRQVFEDPLKTLAHVQRYTDDATGLFWALSNIATALEERGVAYTSDEPGLFLFSLQP